MNREIERKFLVDEAAIPVEARGGGSELTQGYLSYDPSVRVRVSIDPSGDSQGFLTIKGKGTLARDEFEYPVPPEEARAMLALCKATLAKTRYRITAGAHVWELDVFHGPHQGLLLAEIELSHEDEPFERPPWISTEVTHDPRYTNGALAREGRAP